MEIIISTSNDQFVEMSGEFSPRPRYQVCCLGDGGGAPDKPGGNCVAGVM